MPRQIQPVQFKPVSETRFTFMGRNYVTLRFPNARCPTLQQAIDKYDGKNGMAMLGRDESDEIARQHNRRHARFHGLERGEWTHIRDPEAEARSRAAFLVRLKFGGKMYTFTDKPSGGSLAVVLRVTGDEPRPSAPAAQITQEMATVANAIKRRAEDTDSHQYRLATLILAAYAEAQGRHAN